MKVTSILEHEDGSATIEYDADKEETDFLFRKGLQDLVKESAVVLEPYSLAKCTEVPITDDEYCAIANYGITVILEEVLQRKLGIKK